MVPREQARDLRAIPRYSGDPLRPTCTPAEADPDEIAAAASQLR